MKELNYIQPWGPYMIYGPIWDCPRDSHGQKITRVTVRELELISHEDWFERASTLLSLEV